MQSLFSMIETKKVWSQVLLVVGAWVFIQCGGETPNTSTYSAAEQSAAAARVLGRFESADKSTSVEICEGSSSSTAINDCQDSYVIASQGNGKRISDGTSKGGCGGCPFNGVVLPVRITVVQNGVTTTADGVADYGGDDGTSLDRPEVKIYAEGTTVGSFVWKQGVLQQPSAYRTNASVDAGVSGDLLLPRTGNATCR